jgi:hypothetical protein
MRDWSRNGYRTRYDGGIGDERVDTSLDVPGYSSFRLPEYQKRLLRLSLIDNVNRITALGGFHTI